MLFWKKRESVVVTCFTTRYALPELLPPIIRLAKVVPEWWKKQSSNVDLSKIKDKQHWFRPSAMNHSIKHCYALQKLFEKSYGIQLWNDMAVGVRPDGAITGVAPSNQVAGDHHPVEQYEGMISSDWVNYKFVSPWLIYTNRFVPFYISDPFYHIQNHEWITMPGYTEFYHQHHSNINAMFRKPAGTSGLEYKFEAGDIIAYLTPLEDVSIEVKCETIDEKDYQKLEFGQKIWFSAATVARKKNIGGCPIHRS
jgi:hypothetical protein